MSNFTEQELRNIQINRERTMSNNENLELVERREVLERRTTSEIDNTSVGLRETSRPSIEYAAPKNDVVKLRSISIRELDKGFLVNVGCQEIAISSKKDLLKYLKQYILHPQETETKYYNNTLFKD